MGNFRKLGTIGGGTIKRVQAVNMLDRVPRLKRLNGMTPGKPVEYILFGKDGCMDNDITVIVHDDGRMQIFAAEGRSFTMGDLFDIMPREIQEEMIWRMDTVV